MARSIQWYGWHRDNPDHRDIRFKLSPPVVQAIPPSIDLRTTGFLPPVYNQQELGSCTANASCAAYQFDQTKEGLPTWPTNPSRLFVYYNTRAIEGTTDQDSGGQIRDAVSSIVTYGTVPEEELPYDISSFTVKPSDTVYARAIDHKATQYQSLNQSAFMLKGALAMGHPVIFGFSVYDSFESDAVASTGMVNLPTNSESCVGGHAVLIVGYDDATSRFTVRNSWGADWGMAGYFTMPYAYVLNNQLASDFWVITAVS